MTGSIPRLQSAVTFFMSCENSSCEVNVDTSGGKQCSLGSISSPHDATNKSHTLHNLVCAVLLLTTKGQFWTQKSRHWHVVNNFIPHH